MIQLYLPTNNSFQKNGDIVLLPIDCEVKAEVNGEWSLELSHPIDDEGRWRYIVENAVIKAPSFNGEQLFRIVEKDKRDSGVTAVAQPIFLDAIGDCFIQDIRPTNKNGQEALDLILSPNEKYSGVSNIVDEATAYYMLVNAMEAIAGEDNSFLSRWGGEILYNNYEIIINNRIGADYGYQILYGRNIPTDGIHETVDVTNVVTRIVPQAYNGRMISGQTKWVDSPIIDEYPLVFTKVIKYENIVLKKDLQGGDAEGKTVCNNQSQLNTALRNACMEEFDKGIDKPSVSIEADMVLLQNTDEYKDYAILERVGLGDTVHLKHSRLNIIADARVIGLVFDCVREQVTSVTIGDVQANIMNNLSSTMQSVEKAITPAGRVVAEQIQGLIDGSQAQLRLQNDVAERQDVRAILFEDLDEDSPTFGAMSLGTQGFEISRERTADGQDWVWSTFGTAEGFNADLITAGTIEAIDINGSTITGGNIYGTNISGAKIYTDKTWTEEYVDSVGDTWTATYTDVSRLQDGKLSTDGTIISSPHLGTFSKTSNLTSQGATLEQTIDYSDSDGFSSFKDRVKGSSLIDGSQLNINGQMWGTNPSGVDLGHKYSYHIGEESASFNIKNVGMGLSLANAGDDGMIYPQTASAQKVLFTAPRHFVNDSCQGGTDIPNQTLSSGTSWQNLGELTFFEPTVYRCIFYVRFASNSNGRRGICISTSPTGGAFVVMARMDVNAVNGAYTEIALPLNIRGGGGDSDHIYYLNAYQNSGSDLAVTTRFSIEALYGSEISVPRIIG